MSVPANSITVQLQEWWNLTPGGPLRTLDANAVVESPFWGDRKRSPLRDITPNGDDPRKILIDLAHTYAIQGWGKDYLASAIVFLSVHCGVWGTHGDYKSKLDRAWGSFKSWCVTNRKTTSIEDFSPQCLKIKSYLVNIVHFSCTKCTCLNQYFSEWLGFKGAFDPFVTQGCRTFPGVLERALRQPYLANGWALSCKS